MKVVILAGGLGTRISEESHLKPKPMIEIGGQPILWHVMKCFQKYGYNEFIICAGYKQQIIKEYFSHYYLHHNNITFDFTKENKMVNRCIKRFNLTIMLRNKLVLQNVKIFTYQISLSPEINHKNTYQ